MRYLDVETQAAITDRSRFVPRNFVWITARDRDTGDPETVGFWDEPEDVSVDVLSPADGSEVTRTYSGGAILSLDPIPLTIGLDVRTVQLALNPLHASVANLIRGLDPRLARVEIHRGHFNPDTMTLVAPPRIRFLGQVDGAPIATAAEGGESTATLSIASHTRELTRTNPAKKSDEQQQRRSGDRFRRYNTIAGDIPYWWGEASDTAAQPAGLLGWGNFLGFL